MSLCNGLKALNLPHRQEKGKPFLEILQLPEASCRAWKEMGVEIWVSGWKVTGWCPCVVPCLLERCSRLLHASSGEWGRQQIPKESHRKDSSQMLPLSQVLCSQTEWMSCYRWVHGKDDLIESKSLGKKDNTIWPLLRELETMLALSEADSTLILPHAFLGHF